MTEISDIEIPSWLKENDEYCAPSGRDSFISKSLLSIASTLQQLRFDDGVGKFNIPALAKLIVGFLLILLNSLSQNFIFTIVLLALCLVLAATLPIKLLKRTASVTFFATLLAFIICLPAIFLGQPHSAILIAGKTAVSTLIVMLFAVTTPAGEITCALRKLHVPAIFISILELTLKNIVVLGKTASEVLCALKLRSIGKNNQKSESMGGVGGVVLLKAKQAAEDTYDAMRCRGFDGEYNNG